MKQGKKVLRKYYEDYFTTEDSSPKNFVYSMSMNYAQTVLKKTIRDFFLDEIQKRSGNKKIKVLDFGCGNGSTIFNLNRVLPENKSVEFVGVDISKTITNLNRETAKKRGLTNFRFVCADAENVRLKEKFDIIISSEVIEHLPNPEKYIKNVSNLLKENGLLIISTPNASHYLKKVYNLIPKFLRRKLFQTVEKEKKLKQKQFNEHISVQTYKQLKTLLQNNGIRILKRRRSSLLWGNPYADKFPLLYFILILFELLIPQFCVNMGWDMILVGEKII